jgi:hypothetical protein
MRTDTYVTMGVVAGVMTMVMIGVMTFGASTRIVRARAATTCRALHITVRVLKEGNVDKD